MLLKELLPFIEPDTELILLELRDTGCRKDLIPGGFRVPVYKPPGVPAIPKAMAVYGLQGVRGQDPGSGRMPPGAERRKR